ncbi:MAG: TPM domain-containing protein [Syntrophaceae bacterium]|nr:TPM domain-containing protein [Syntrophaceae bacterium]
MNIRKFGLVCIVILLTLSSGRVTYGQNGYPPPSDDYVNDYANILSETDTESIRKMLKDLEYKTGIEAVVVTINSIGDYNTADTTIESFATNLFNSWGIGHKKENNGILILVAVKDRKCRIELGGGYGERYDSSMKQVIEENMIPYFKTDDYSRGIYEGTRGVIEKVTKKVSWFSFYKWHILIGILIIVCIFAGISCMRSGKKGWGWAFFAAAGVLFLFLFRMLSKGKSSSGFGGGSSFGGGASGSW